MKKLYREITPKAWQEAMKSEIQSMYYNKVRTCVDLPNEKMTIYCKWIFKRNMDLSGNISTNKACLVAKGFSQIHGIDYKEIFWAVSMFKSKLDYACYCYIS